MKLFVVLECNFHLVNNLKDIAIASANQVLLIIFADVKEVMILFCLLNPAILNHFEEHVSSKHDLNLIKTIRRGSHSNQVTKSVSEGVFLHLEVESVCQLD